MVKAILTAVLIILLNVLVGCGDADRSQLMPARTGTSLGSVSAVKVANAGEADIIEQVVVNRLAYRQGLELLVEHYTRMGNNMKLRWAEKELAALDTMPQYNYIVEAGLAGPDLKASTSIREADYLYYDALELEEKAGPFKNENLLRRALDKYNQLIRRYPSSNKIDDAAFRAGGIYEHFKDYTIALLYHQRAYQWDPETIHPARFRAAFILDKRLHRRAEALEVYQQAVKKESGYERWNEFAEKRIRELTKSDERGE